MCLSAYSRSTAIRRRSRAAHMALMCHWRAGCVPGPARAPFGTRHMSSILFPFAPPPQRVERRAALQPRPASRAPAVARRMREPHTALLRQGGHSRLDAGGGSAHRLTAQASTQRGGGPLGSAVRAHTGVMLERRRRRPR